MKCSYTCSIFKRCMYLCFMLLSVQSIAGEKENKNIPLNFTDIRYNNLSTISVNNKMLKSIAAITITGTVKDQSGDPLPGVSIKLKNTNVATTTNVNGKYLISVPNASAILQFSFVGFLTQQVIVGKRTVINVSLKDDAKLLNEVTVVDVGYGNIEKKSDLTGSIGIVSVEDLQKAPVVSFEEALAGRVAGVQVLSADGQPGDGMDIVVRGESSINNSNSPLYVIDGIPLEDPDNNNLNPAEIESISILKDASSTAIYGSRAANGVVIIKTKQGKLGKAVINYNSYFGSNITTGRVNLMNSADFVRLQFELDSTFTNTNYFNKVGSTGLPADTLRPVYSIQDYENEPALDFQNKLFETASFQNHYLSASGGNAKGDRYLFSGGYTDREGVIIASGFKRAQGRLNINQNINEKLNITANINYAFSKTFGTYPRNQESQNSLANNPQNNLLYRVWGYRPTNISFVDPDSESNLEDGLYDDEQGAGPGANLVINPFISVQNQYKAKFANNFSASTTANYKFNNNLSYRINASAAINTLRSERFDSPRTNSGIAFGANGSIGEAQSNNFSIDNILTYSKAFSRKSRLTIIGLASQQWRKNLGNAYSTNQILFPSLGIGGIPSGQVQPGYSVRITSANLLGFGGTAAFNYLDRYVFKGSFRADGSSKFAKENRWGYFPSGGFAWKVSQEPFMKNVKAISDLKFRINYGLTGNNRISDFPYLSPFDQTNTSGFVYGGTYYSGYYQTSLGNRELKWETTAQFDTGLEFDLFKNKFSVEIDYYKKFTKDLLLDAKFPLSSGYASGVINVGKTSNEGFEFTLNANFIRNKNFSYNSNFNISFNRNRLVELSDGRQNLIDKAETKNPTSNYISQVGQAIGLFYGFTYDGVYQYSDFNKLPTGVYVLKDEVVAPNGGVLGYTRASVKPGDPKYKDVNRDGIVDDNDQGIIGQAKPIAVGGFNNNFRYKNFSLNLFFQWAYGGSNFNFNKYYFENPSRLGLNQFESYLNRWSPTNPTNYAPRAGADGTNVTSSRLVEDASYLRFKTAQIVYNLPTKWLSRLKISSLAVNASALNIFTITNYSGPDPEVNTRGTGLTPAYDFSAYPRAFTYTVGLNVKF